VEFNKPGVLKEAAGDISDPLVIISEISWHSHRTGAG